MAKAKVKAKAKDKAKANAKSKAKSTDSKKAKTDDSDVAMTEDGANEEKKATKRGPGRPRKEPSEKKNAKRARGRISIPEGAQQVGAAAKENDQAEMACHSTQPPPCPKGKKEHEVPNADADGRSTFAGRKPPTSAVGARFWKNLRVIVKNHAPETSERQHRELWNHVKESNGGSMDCPQDKMLEFALEFLEKQGGERNDAEILREESEKETGLKAEENEPQLPVDAMHGGA